MPKEDLEDDLERESKSSSSQRSSPTKKKSEGFSFFIHKEKAKRIAIQVGKLDKPVEKALVKPEVNLDMNSKSSFSNSECKLAFAYLDAQATR